MDKKCFANLALRGRMLNMKKLLLIAGIIFIIVCVLLLAYGAIMMLAYNNLYDGTAAHYKWLYGKMMTAFISGGVFGVLGAVLIVLRSRL